MATKTLWDFKVNWVGDTHILLAMSNKDYSEEPKEILLSVREYSEFMQLLQGFNLHFKDKIDQQLIQSYLNG